MITKDQVEKAQQVWGDGVVQLGALKDQRAELEQAVANHVDALYGYQLGPVLFCPTRAREIQFRRDRVGAISYFIGGNEAFPEDQGFALQPWTKVRFENSDLILEERRAIAMGNYFFTDTSGAETKVEYSFGYRLDDAGALRIDLHHSALPFGG